MPTVVKFHRNREHGSVGCTIGLAPHLYVGGFGFNPLDAFRQAASAASGLVDTVNENPALSTALTAVFPVAGVALKTLAAAAHTANQATQQGATPKEAVQQVAATHGTEAAGLITSLLKALL